MGAGGADRDSGQQAGPVARAPGGADRGRERMALLRAAQAARQGDRVLGQGRLQHQGDLPLLRHPVAHRAQEPDRRDRRVRAQAALFRLRLAQV